MSTIHRDPRIMVPPLVEGERLDAATFMERYEAMPPGTWAELIGGVVVMPSPVSAGHGRESLMVAGWLFRYLEEVPGLSAADNATALLDDLAVPQPDFSLMILPELGGQTRIEGSYFAGAPELVIEVARSSRKTDLGAKKEEYRRTGVLEYLVVTLDPDEIHWFVRRGDQFQTNPPGTDGIYRSEIFPGLWLNPDALFALNPRALVATLLQGRASPECAEFVAKLSARAG
jgi:Uma2 family endonuclease